jgi:hypothetical protein
MTSKWISSLIAGFALIGMTLSSALPASAEQAPDKNGPGVARVSVVQGSVVVQRGDSNKQVSAVVNAPLLPGDYVSTGASARGELQFDGSTAVRLGGSVQARITNDDPNNRQLQLADGTIVVGLVRSAGMVQVDTPSVTVRASQAGDYRISIGRDGSSWVTTRRGSARVVTPARTYTLEPGRTLVARGSASNPSITFTSEVAYDSFDDFNAKRDQTMIAALNASPNLNPDIAGYENLGAYGQWQDVAGYGQVWVPTQSSGWSPYSNGSWTWEDGYGWTWVANEPWGWAPYHYGNWFYANGYGWAWYPPAYSAYPAWSPALVGFFGFGASFGGPGWGVSLGFGYPYLGWYPLAPYWPYYPWYPGWAWTGWGWGWPGWGWSGCCWGSNVVNVTNITNIYRYFPHGGVHGTAVGNLQHGTVSGHIFGVNQHNVGSHVGMIHGAVPVTPGRDSLGFGGRTIAAPVTLSKAFDSARFASANRALSGRMPFDQQAKVISQAIHGNAAHESAPVTRDNAVSRENAAVSHESAASRDAVVASHGNEATPHENAVTSRENETTPEHAGSDDSWQRFNQARGNEVRGSSIAARSARAESSSASRESFASEGSREERAPSTSWSRFSQQRGNVSVIYGDREPPSHNVTYGNSSGRESAYGRNPYEGSSYSHSSYPSYARGSEGSYPSYSRGSYGSYPSYSRGSYGSYPSYSRGSYGSSPSYSRGSYSGGEHPSGGGSAPHGGGGAPHGSGGGRPPH